MGKYSKPFPVVAPDRSDAANSSPSVFLIWSGKESLAIADAFRFLLTSTLPQWDVLLSTQIDKGIPWNAELARRFRVANFAVVFLVPGNAQSPWINFEAGAIANATTFGDDPPRISPFLVDVEQADLPSTLSQFQCTQFDKAEVRSLVMSINKSVSQSRAIDKVFEAFDSAWELFENKVQSRPRNYPDEPQSSVASEKPIAEEDLGILIAIGNSATGGADISYLSAIKKISPQRVQLHVTRLEERGLVLFNMFKRRYDITQTGRELLHSKRLLH